MKKLNYLFIALAATIFAGCEQEEKFGVANGTQIMENVVITAGTDEGTRTGLNDEGGIEWRDGDELSVWYGGTTMNHAVLESIDAENAKVGTFVIEGKIYITGGTTEGGVTYNALALYPYDANAVRTGANTITTTYPAVQQYAEESFGAGSPMVFAGNVVFTDNLSFKNTASWMKFGLTGEKAIRKIELTSNAQPLAGAATITAEYSKEPTVAIDANGSKTVTLDCGTEGVQLSNDAAVTFHITLPPMSTAADELTLTIYDTEGGYMTTTVTEANEFARNIIVNFGTVAYAAEDEVSYTLVNTAEELQAAIDAAEDGVETEIVIGTDINTLQVKVPAAKNIVLTGITSDITYTGQIKVTGKLAINNMNIAIENAVTTDSGASSDEISQYRNSAIALMNSGDVVCENVTFNLILAESTAITAWWSTDDGANITVKECTFNCNGQRPIRSDACVTVENCTFNDPYRYAVQMTSKSSTMAADAVAVVNFKNNTINAGTTSSKTVVYGVQLEGETYGCSNLTINGEGNSIVLGTTGKTGTMYYCECGKIDHATIVWNTEVAPVHASPIVTMNGKIYDSLAEAVAAMTSNEATIQLSEGTFTLPTSLSGKSIVIEGAETAKATTIVDMSDGGTAQYGATSVTFKNLTMKRKADSYGGLSHSSAEHYDNCIIEGTLVTYAPTVTVKNTAFVPAATEYYNVHIYAAGSTTFEDCTFTTSKGRSVYAHGDNAAREYNITFSGCEFISNEANTSNSAPAIRLHTEYGIYGTLTINDCTNNDKFNTEINGGLWVEWNNNTKAYTYNFTKSIDGVNPDGFTYDAETSTYSILSAQGLRYIANEVNSGSNTFSGATVKLAANIDLENQLWTPIGLNADGSNKFKGTFDGDGKTISNLTVTKSAAYEAAGLFGALNGTAKNFTIDGATINAISSGSATDNGIAVVAGSLYNTGTIEGVTVKNATVNGNRMIGGISGYVYGNIKNCTVENITLTCTPDNLTGSYNNGDKAGGIAGYFASENTYTISGNTAKNVTITAYRDMGIIVGCTTDAAAVNGNTVDGTNYIYPDWTYYYGDKDVYAGEVIGRNTGSNTLGQNTISGTVTIATLKNDNNYTVDENGNYIVKTATALSKALAAGATSVHVSGDITLTAGLSANNVTFTGITDDAAINFDGNNIGGDGTSTVTYKNLTLTTVSLPNTADNGERYGWYGGIDYVRHATSNYENCKISGVFTTYCTQVNVKNCEFHPYIQDGEEFYHIFVYTGNLNVEGSTFYYGDRAIKIYNEGGNKNLTVSISDSKFKADELTSLNKALINIDATSIDNIALSYSNLTIDKELEELDIVYGATEGKVTVTAGTVTYEE